MRFILNKNFFTNTHRFTTSHPDYRRIYMLNVILVAIIPISLFCALVNLIHFHYFAAAAIDLILLLCAFLTLYYFHKTNDSVNAAYLTVFILLATLSAYIILRGNTNYALYWICCYPPYLYFQLGIKKGRLLTEIYGIGLLLYIFSNYKYWSQTNFSIIAIGNLFFATLVLILLINNFEQSRNEVSTFLEEKNKEFEIANEALQDSKEQLRLILDSTAEAIYGIDLQDNCTFCNSSCLTLLGYQRQEDLLGRNMHSQILRNLDNGTTDPREDCRILKALHDGKGLHVKDEIFWKSDGTSFDVEYHSYPQYKDKKVIGAVITFMDITERKKVEDELWYLSYHDSLTGLLNKGSFLNQVSKMDTENNLPISILFGDINGLKLINDIFGHNLGDELIQKSAEVIRRICRDADIVARAGGDEFFILLPNTDAEAAEAITSRITTELSKEQICSIHCSMSMGYDTKTVLTQSIEQTMLNAESKMYKNKTMKHSDIGSNMLNTIITTLHNKYPRERQHSINTGNLCSLIGTALQLPETQIKKLGQVGYMHDIGKIVMSEEILQDDVWTEEERLERQKHPIMGYRILNLFDGTLDLAEAVYSHHENWDGSGYPKGLKGKEIPVMARIIAVAEAYDAMTNLYLANPIPKAEALQKMEVISGKKIDPEITGVFIDLMSQS